MGIPENRFYELFQSQQENRQLVANTTASQRISKLKALKRALEGTYRQKIREALFADFKKPFIETDLTEIYQVTGEIKLAIANLDLWMRKHKVNTPLTLAGTSSWIQYEPKGVCLIMSPWNFPINLTLGPLVSAVAAGNTVILKPSEMTPNSAAVMEALIKEVFPENEVALVQGEVETAQELLKLPFDHIFFTGSPAVGKIVMKAAAEHLASVTLELGGKSPTIVDETAHLKTAARRIAWGKFLNAGQICVSPDYLLVHENVKQQFETELIQQLKTFYSENIADSDSYARVVNSKHYKRLLGYLEDAQDKEGRIVYGGAHKEEEFYIEPTLITDLPDSAALLQEEIFGPLLPILTFKEIAEVLDHINRREKPLALYLYSRNKKTIKKILNGTSAGSTAINTNVLQYANHHLPFGGINNSGTGKSHGFYGFQEFSNQRSVLRQHTKSLIELLFPPYNSLKQKLANFTIKWF